MYGTQVYLIGRALAGYLLQSTFPILLTCVLYWGLSIPITFENFFLFLAASCLIHYNGVSLGYFAGVIFDDETGARTLGNFILLFFMLVSGGLANAGSFPPVIA